jgi:hypothetical protein
MPRIAVARMRILACTRMLLITLPAEKMEAAPAI